MKMNENVKFECGLDLMDVELAFKDFMEEFNYSINECDLEFNLVYFRNDTTHSVTVLEIDMEHLNCRKRWRRKCSTTVCSGSIDLQEMKSLIKAFEKIDSFKTNAFINSSHYCKK